MATIAWVKYRSRHSSGPGEWNWTEIEIGKGETPDQALRDAMEVFNDELCTYSEHWRGIEAEYAKPPQTILVEKLINAQKAIEDLQAAQRRWGLQYAHNHP